MKQCNNPKEAMPGKKLKYMLTFKKGALDVFYVSFISLSKHFKVTVVYFFKDECIITYFA